MPKRLDLMGKKFGGIEVLSFVCTRKEGRRSRSIWRCRCRCGRIYETRGDALKAGATSCGCMRGHGHAQHNLSGTRVGDAYGRLLRAVGRDQIAKVWLGARGMIDFARWYYENLPSQSGPKSVVRHTERRKFSPGNCKIVLTRTIPRTHRLQLKGRTFGALTVLKFEGMTRVGASANSESRWLCRCRCGRRCVMGGYKLHSAQRVDCGCGYAYTKMPELRRRVIGGLKARMARKNRRVQSALARGTLKTRRGVGALKKKREIQR